MSLELDRNRIVEYTDLDLRDEAQKEHLDYLRSWPEHWRNELIVMKRKAETQMTSCKARRFNNYIELLSGEINQDEYLIRTNKEKIWKVNASRFIQQIESKLVELKYD